MAPGGVAPWGVAPGPRSDTPRPFQPWLVEPAQLTPQQRPKWEHGAEDMRTLPVANAAALAATLFPAAVAILVRYQWHHSGGGLLAELGSL